MSSCRTTKRTRQELARSLNMSLDQVKTRVAQLHEANPMLGHRGDRLAVTYPEILEMQVQAIIEAACDMQEGGNQGSAGDHDSAGRHEEGIGLPQEVHGRDRRRA